MFKVAFPGASEDDEKREMEWVSGAPAHASVVDSNTR
jgi:hypothetical protein